MITVVADDLTGAAEIAGICLRYKIEVAFGIDAIPEKPAQVTIIATDTRSLTEDEAFKVHVELTNQIIQNNPNQIIFKKCDSVLRGHVLTELLALMTVSGKTAVLLQPSNPVGNRCIIEGIYYVNGIKIENTGFASDPDFPAKTASVKSLLLDRSSKKNTVQVHVGNIAEINSEGIYIPDCNSESDLIENLKICKKNHIIGGSAALFEQFLIKLKLASTKKETEKLSFSNDYLLVSGSAHSESIKFAKSLQFKGCALQLLPNELLQKDVDEAVVSEFIKNISEIYIKNKKLVLRISDDTIQFKNSSKILKNRLSFIVKRFLETLNVSELCIEGGATAYDLLKKLNWQSFTPTEELALGVVRMKYDLDEKKHIILKPGSYQWPNKLMN